MTKEEQFSVITGLLLNYETGDFLLLSDLSDVLVNLKDFFLDIEAACLLIDKLLNCITAEMKKAGIPGFAEGISAAVDLLQGLAFAIDETARADAIDAINAYACRIKDKAAESAAPEEEYDKETL
ncbi:hypothetical protein MASR2M29_20480 [Spirochaetota bacterium]